MSFFTLKIKYVNTIINKILKYLLYFLIYVRLITIHWERFIFSTEVLTIYSVLNINVLQNFFAMFRWQGYFKQQIQFDVNIL